MKAAELRACDLCGKGLLHTGLPLFHRIRFETMGVDAKAVRERIGLHAIFGTTAQGAALAEVFAPTAELANPIAGCDTLLVCQTCSTNMTDPLPIMMLAERAAEASKGPGPAPTAEPLGHGG